MNADRIDVLEDNAIPEPVLLWIVQFEINTFDPLLATSMPILPLLAITQLLIMLYALPAASVKTTPVPVQSWT